MTDPTAMILRFDGDPDDLAERCERARRLWMDAHADHDPPSVYMACKTEGGIVIVTGWSTDRAHKEFRAGIRGHLQAARLPRPDSHEHLRIETLGWR